MKNPEKQLRKFARPELVHYRHALRQPIQLFVSCFLQGVLRHTGLTRAALEEALDIPSSAVGDTLGRYFAPVVGESGEAVVPEPPSGAGKAKKRGKSRTVKRKDVQDLENKVAAFLGRQPFRLVVKSFKEKRGYYNHTIYGNTAWMRGGADEVKNYLPSDQLADLKLIRSSLRRKDIVFCIQHEGLLFYGQELYGKNFPPSQRDLFHWRYVIDFMPDALDKSRSKKFLRAFECFLNQFLDKETAGNLPEYRSYAGLDPVMSSDVNACNPE